MGPLEVPLPLCSGIFLPPVYSASSSSKLEPLNVFKSLPKCKQTNKIKNRKPCFDPEAP